MEMSSPPTYKESQSQAGNLPEPKQVVPETPQVLASPTPQQVDCTGNSASPSEESPSPHSQEERWLEIEREGQGSLSIQLKNKCLVLSIGLTEIIVGVCLGLITFFSGKSVGTVAVVVYPVFVRIPLLTSFMTLMTFLRSVMQVSMGIGLIWGISKESRTISSLQGWIQCAYFIAGEMCFSLFINIIKLTLGAREFDELTAWLKLGCLLWNSFDMLFRFSTFFLLKNYLTELEEKRENDFQELEVGFVQPVPSHSEESDSF